MHDSTRKIRGRPFKQGNAGRPRGARNRATVAIETLLEGEAEGLARRAVRAALAGDVAALRLCLDRIAPARRDRLVSFDLPAVEKPGDLPVALQHLVRAVSAGDLTPAEAEATANLLDRWRASVETAELAIRIAALEARSEGP